MYNLYNSIATYRNFPVFSWKSSHRKKQYDIWTGQQKYLGNICNYTFYLDFDNKDNNFLLTKNEVIQASNYLDKNKIKHKIIFSGSGFHIRAEMVKERRNPDHARMIAKKIQDQFLLSTVDFSIYRWQGRARGLVTKRIRPFNGR
jgi:hypothetical protein